jgi:hypothetical protein
MRLVPQKTSTTATISPMASLSNPSRFTAALWEWIQYSQLLVIETASAMISLVSGSSLPGFMTTFNFCQTASRCSGFTDRAFQKLGTKSIFLVALMSS